MKLVAWSAHTHSLTHSLTYTHTRSLTHTLIQSLNHSITHSLTHSLYAAVLLEKLTGFQPVKKFPTFYGTPSFTTAFTRVRHLSLSWTSSIQSMPPHPTSWRYILILSSHLRLGLLSGLFPSDFPTKTLYTPLLSIRATCPAHLILLDFITRTTLGEQYRSLSSFYSFLHSPVTSSLLGPNILLNSLFSNTLSQRERPSFTPSEGLGLNSSRMRFFGFSEQLVSGEPLLVYSVTECARNSNKYDKQNFPPPAKAR